MESAGFGGVLVAANFISPGVNHRPGDALILRAKNRREHPMRIVTIAVAAVGALTLAACGSPAEKAAEKQADAVEQQGEATADSLEKQADAQKDVGNQAAGEALDQKADAVEESADKTADAIEQKAEQ